MALFYVLIFLPPSYVFVFAYNDFLYKIQNGCQNEENTQYYYVNKKNTFLIFFLVSLLKLGTMISLE